MISKLPISTQNHLIFKSLHISYTFDQLMEYVRQQFFVLHQEDEAGPYSALAFGNECLSIATWTGWDTYPLELDDTFYTPDWMEDGETLKCEHLLLFIEFWIEYYRTTLGDFLSDLEHATE